MAIRAEQKQESRNKILNAAATRLRSEGMAGAGIAAVMKDAGLTHGAFYSHFRDKNELNREALIHALCENRKAWVGKPRKESWPRRLVRLAKRYLTPAHRQTVSESCALAALCSEAARGEEAFKRTYEQELRKTLSAICGEDFEEADLEKAEQALAFFSLLVGSLALSRAVHSKSLSDRLLDAGKAAAAKLAAPEES
ncbi:MAG: TetR/AcrR family transcriptional regulator [Desulfococcaceae bacterium]